MKKTVLITGGSGLLALSWANTIRESHSVVLGLNKRNISLGDVSAVPFDFSSYDVLYSDIQRINPDIIVHTAGLTNVEACENDPALAYKVNVELAGNIAKICSAMNAKMVHISTDHLFDGTQPNADEALPTAPLNVYGGTKLEAEKAVMENNPLALVIRTNFYGWGPSYRLSFSDSILNALRAGKEIHLFKDVFFTPILIQSLVGAVHELIGMDAAGIFNIVGGERITKYEFGIRLAREFNLDQNLIKPINFTDKSGLTKRPMDMSLSNSKLYSTLGRELGDTNSQLKMLHDLEGTPGIADIQKL